LARSILVAWRVTAGAALVLAANRDELLARETGGPRVLRDQPRAVGGVDLVAGGTWMAVAPGRVAAVTNRQVGVRDPARRSRGELPLDLLGEPDDDAVERRLTSLDPAAYNPCNALHVSRGRALVAHLDGSGRARLVELDPGPHVLTTVDVDAADDARVARLRAGMEAVVARCHPAAELLQRLERLLQDHGPDRAAGPDAACIHGDVYGTRSSSSAVVWDDGRVGYRHAPGRPCVTPREDLTALLA